MGTGFSTMALVLWFGFSDRLEAFVVLGLLFAAAALESFAGYCLGCRVFGLLMRAGMVPEEVCEACSDLRLRHPELAAGGQGATTSSGPRLKPRDGRATGSARLSSSM